MAGPSRLFALPRVGETIYIPDIACSEHGTLVVHGGRATVSEVGAAPGPEGPVPLVRFEGLIADWFCYDVLRKYQGVLRLQYGEAEARLDPDGCFGGSPARGLAAISTLVRWEDDPRSRPPAGPGKPWQPH